MANRAEGADVVLVPAGDREALQDHFLDTARALMLFGAVATIGATSADADPKQAFLGLILWLLGVCLIAALVPAAARRFPPHAALAATAMAAAILKHSFTLWN